MKSVSIRVWGTVQGVFFRQGTQRKAQQLGVRGWVQNEPDGSVTAHVEGDDAAVDAMVEWCETGPDAAEVTDMRVEDAPVESHASFEVRR